MVDSTACLIGSNAAYAKLALQRLPPGQPDVQQDNPVSRHAKFEMRLVMAGLGLRCFLKHRGHARMRHVCFQCDTRSRYRFRSRISQLQNERCPPDLWGGGRYFVFHRDYRRGFDGLGTPSYEPSGNTAKRETTQTDIG